MIGTSLNYDLYDYRRFYHHGESHKSYRTYAVLTMVYSVKPEPSKNADGFQAQTKSLCYKRASCVSPIIETLVKFLGFDRGFERGKQLTSLPQYRQKHPQR